MASVKDLLEEELIFGARDREARWRKIALVSLTFGAAGCLLAGVEALVIDKPPPVLVPFDPATGVALPQARVGTIGMHEKEAVLQSLIHAYVHDRETYNQLDNDLRIKSVIDRSTGEALTSLNGLWDAANPNYPPSVYGSHARIDVAIASITQISNQRAQARITKRLTSPDGVSEGTFVVTLAYDFEPSTLRDLQDIWNNPFGFKVKDYRVVAERFKAKEASQ
ncbi:type IV secretion system protein [Martelella alba]|uniref:Type IV secretion system protein n=1 Tax=Martelella alba TaxID=2590451 RepID=A0A506U259_9HYPH|nr:type IV secretion system protein [Martelella alba]TPW27065.1 type IV secretion system protein [Martelella alba]